MILIFSNKNDFTTNLVQDWLYYYGKEAVRINDNADRIRFGLNGIKIIKTAEHESVEMDLHSVQSCWFRKGRIVGMPDERDPISASEHQVVKEYIQFLLNGKNVIGDVLHDNMVNKLIVLSMAEKIGLSVPATYLLDNKADLTELLVAKPAKEYIIKMKTETSMFHFDDGAAIVYTNNLLREDLYKFSAVFIPTLIQEKVDKYFEIRTFYLDGTMWSMAIFSQSDEKTKDDYRKYNFTKPNRNTPFKIPDLLETQLTELMNSLGLRTGSIDWILSKDGQFYFLEINPTGQFSNLSMTCNYPLEQLIAATL